MGKPDIAHEPPWLSYKALSSACVTGLPLNLFFRCLCLKLFNFKLKKLSTLKLPFSLATLTLQELQDACVAEKLAAGFIDPQVEHFLSPVAIPSLL
jgi:hypothetical protein